MSIPDDDLTHFTIPVMYYPSAEENRAAVRKLVAKYELTTEYEYAALERFIVEYCTPIIGSSSDKLLLHSVYFDECERYA